MTTRPKDRGTAFETLIVTYLQQFWPQVERRSTNGAKDRGDVSGLPVVLELKNQKTMNLSAWMKELHVEMDNAGVIGGALVHKRRGVGDAGLQWATVETWFLVDLLLAWIESNHKESNTQ